MVTKHEEYSEFANSLGVKRLFFKREDLHPYGSHKGRSVPKMIDKYIKEGIKNFAVSSSGNTALAAAFYINKLNSTGYELGNTMIKLSVLVGQHISVKKFNKLEQFKSPYINITMHDRPLQTLFNMTRDEGTVSLRQSTDDSALIGYSELAEELTHIPDLQAVFMGTSSGTTAQALLEYFDLHNMKTEMHIVQTSSCHPIADAFVDNPIDEQSIAGAIVDHNAIRKNKVIALIDKIGGGGWIASNEHIVSAQELTNKHTGLSISTNSALSVAGLMQAVYTGKTWDGSVACIICGD